MNYINVKNILDIISGFDVKNKNKYLFIKFWPMKKILHTQRFNNKFILKYYTRIHFYIIFYHLPIFFLILSIKNII